MSDDKLPQKHKSDQDSRIKNRGGRFMPNPANDAGDKAEKPSTRIVNIDPWPDPPPKKK